MKTLYYYVPYGIHHTPYRIVSATYIIIIIIISLLPRSLIKRDVMRSLIFF